MTHPTPQTSTPTGPRNPGHGRNTGELLLGIDYGGTSSKLLLARCDGDAFTHVRSHRIVTPRSLPALAASASAFLGPDHPAALGITVPGVLDEATGTVRASTNLPWLTGANPARELAAALGVPAVAVHDGNAAAAAEATLGAGRGSDDLFVLALGTGIAGAHIVGGQLRRGAHGAAGEVGHIGSGTGRLCSCGQRGCLESEVGGAQLAARWAESRAATIKVTGGIRAVDDGARSVVEAASSGDPAAIALLDDATTTLSHSLLGIVALIDPGLIVIGGGLAESRTWILDPVVHKTTRGATFHRLPPIVPAELGVWAGAWGAVLAASERRHTW